MKKALSLMPAKSSVSWGGSATIEEIGLLDKVKSGPYKVLDRSEASTPEEKEDMLRRALSVDFYLTSFNGVSMDGIVFNIDGTGNRVASTLYGHQKVYLVISRNKLAEDYESALWRARNIAAPKNAQRLNRKTPCAVKADRCYDCKSPERICRGLAVLWARPNATEEMEVVLIGEALGM